MLPKGKKCFILLPEGNYQKVNKRGDNMKNCIKVKVDFLNEYLKNNNLSESEFAKTIGVAHSTVNRVINGKRNPGGKFITGVLSNYSDLKFEQVFTYMFELPKGNKTA